MKKSIIYVTALAFVWILTSCSVSVPLMITNNPIGSKMGKSTTAAIFTGGQGAAIAPMRGTMLYNGLMFNKEFGVGLLSVRTCAFAVVPVERRCAVGVV